MANLNKVMLIGNLTRDPDVKVLQSGSTIAEFGLAINRSWVQDGVKKEEATFVDVVMFGKVGEIAGKWLKKGKPVYVEGRLKLEQWEKDGEKRSKLRVVGEMMQMLGSAPGNAEKGAAKPTQDEDNTPF
jgi:single-strand DNA-binding protein